MRKSAENTEVKKTDKHTKKIAETKVKNQTAENQNDEAQNDEALLDEEDKKLPKLVPASKLPKNLKKQYTKKKLDKFLKKIYITKDRAIVEELFVPVKDKDDLYHIPQDSVIPRAKFSRVKKIGKDVASQKLSIKFVPLTATVIAIAVVLMLIFAFKNFVVKWLLTQGMQKAFGAKTDIAYVDVDLFGAKISVRNLDQGYRNDPWKNLFELDEFTLDFNLTELLRGKIDIQNVAVEGINVMTPRTTSAELPKAASGKDGSIPEFFNERAQIAEQAAKEELQKLFDQFNPENMLKNLESQLESPKVAKEVYETGDALVKKWQAKPEEMQKEIQAFSDKTNEIMNADWSNMNDPVTIKNNITKIDSAIKYGQKIVDETKKVVDEVKSDSKTIKVASEKIKKALDHDTKFVNTEVKKITSFKMEDSIKLISGPINTIVYKTAGKYYPYIMQLVSLSKQSKSSSSGSQAEEVKASEKSQGHERLAGVDVYYKRNNVPKFLLERLSCSGVNWSGLATEISSDMDVRGKPAFAEAKMFIEGQNHKGNITVDARTLTDQPLVTVNYEGDNYPIAFEVPEFAMSSKSEITGRGTITDKGDVTIGAGLNLKGMKFQTQKFEPEYAYNIYTRALDKLTEMSLDVELFFNSDHTFDMKLTSDADKKFAQILKELINEEIQSIIKQATSKLNELIQEQTKDANLKIEEFIDIENGINAESIKLDKINKLLEEKKAELTKKISQQAKSSIGGALGEQTSGALKNILGGDKSSNPLGNVLKGF